MPLSSTLGTSASSVITGRASSVVRSLSIAPIRLASALSPGSPGTCRVWRYTLVIDNRPLHAERRFEVGVLAARQVSQHQLVPPHVADGKRLGVAAGDRDQHLPFGAVAVVLRSQHNPAVIGATLPAQL